MSASGIEANCAHGWAPRPGKWSGPNIELTPVPFLWEVAYFVLKICISPCEPCNDLSALLILTHLILLTTLVQESHCPH